MGEFSKVLIMCPDCFFLLRNRGDTEEIRKAESGENDDYAGRATFSICSDEPSSERGWTRSLHHLLGGLSQYPGMMIPL